MPGLVKVIYKIKPGGQCFNQGKECEGFSFGLCVPWQLSYKGKPIWLHSLRCQHLPSSQPCDSYRLNYRLKHFLSLKRSEHGLPFLWHFSNPTFWIWGESPNPKHTVLSPLSITVSQKCQHCISPTQKLPRNPWQTILVWKNVWFPTRPKASEADDPSFWLNSHSPFPTVRVKHLPVCVCSGPSLGRGGRPPPREHLARNSLCLLLHGKERLSSEELEGTLLRGFQSMTSRYPMHYPKAEKL